MAAEVESQEQQKNLKFTEDDGCKLPSSLDAVVEKSWSQAGSTDGKSDSGDNASTKSAPGLSSGGGLGFGKDELKSSAELLGSGSIWGQKSGIQAGDGVWSTTPGGVDWGISGDGISNVQSKDVNKSNPWGGSVMQDNQGTTNALGLSLDFWKPGALGVTGNWGDARGNNWGVPDLKTEFNKGLPDKKITEADKAKGIWNTTEDRKVEPIGPVQRRSASLTELNVTFESSLGNENLKFSSTSKVGLNDERSQPDGAEVSQQNREELIAKMINSNEGWGKKPIIQETPWHMDSVTLPPLADSLPAPAEDPAATKNDVFWNVPKETNNAGWNNPTPAANTYDWAPDSDIGMWNGPPPPESVNPNMWTGPPKEPTPVWLGGQSGMGQVGLDKNMMQHGSVGWGERGLQGQGMDKFTKDFTRDSGRGTETWGQQQQPRGVFSNNWTPTEGNTWTVPHPADQQDSWGGKQSMNSFSSTGFGAGPKVDTIQKIGTWGEGSFTETGLWNQPQPLSNMQNTLQQLMDLGLKKEEAIMLQNNMGKEKIIELLKAQKENEQPKGRIIRGKSMVEMQSDHFGQFQGGRNSGFQTGGRGSLFQPPLPGGIPQQMQQMKGSGMQQSAAGGWNGIYGRTPSMPMANSNLMQQPSAQMNPQMLQSLLNLQSMLQPLLHQRSQVQHSRNLTPMQKSYQIDQLNIHISDLKNRIDQVQMSCGPPNMAGATSAAVLPPDALDEVKMMQLLNQLKLDRDFGGVPHPPLGTVNELTLGDGKTQVGAIPNLSMGQWAALIGSNQWLNPDSSSGMKDKLPTDILPDAWSNMGQVTNAGSKLGGWPTSGDMGLKGSRPPPPPGLGNCEKTDMFWGQHAMNRSTSWAPGQLGSPSNWLILKNISAMTDPGILQKICLSYGPLQKFYFNKTLGQVLACYINCEDVMTALASISQSIPSIGSSRLVAEPVAVEEIGRLIDNNWIQMPPSSALFGAAPPSGKMSSMRGVTSGWGPDVM